jgi:adenosylmethionine-8-amino-7-oxononanoate aminotransferase
LNALDRVQLEKIDRTAVWHAFTQMAEYQPFIVDRAEGCTLFDLDGNAYLDGVSSLWCNVHGHKHPHIDAAIRAQLDRVAHVTNLGSSNPTTIQLAQRLTEIAPAGLNHVFFSSDGACAVEAAIKMALQYWRQRDDPRPNKTRYLALADAYHGDTLGAVSVGGVERFHAMFEPLLFPVLRAGVAKDGTSDEQLAATLAAMEQLFEQHHHELAAVVIEPLIQCAAGMKLHPPELLAALRQLCSRYEVLLIADEVATGFGRTGTMFACQREQVSPDLLCLGKGLTGGYLPMAATLATDEIWNAFLGSFAESKTFFHGHTFGGNPLCAAAALASIEVFENEQVLEHLPAKIDRLATHLAKIAELPHVGEVRQCGLIAGIELVRDRATGEHYAWEERRGQAVCDIARAHGVLLRPLSNVVVIMPPLAISLDELDRIAAAVTDGIAAL